MVEMKERPIIFSGLMVRAILEGRKTQTRRIVSKKMSPYFSLIGKPGMLAPVVVDRHGEEGPGPEVFGAQFEGPDGDEYLLRCKYGGPGDRLWVRETFQPIVARGVNWSEADWKTGNGYAPRYLATDERAEWSDATRDDEITDRAMSPLHMPRWASRILLEIESVRVERLDQITEEDAKAEGVKLHYSQEEGQPAKALTPITGPYIPKAWTFLEHFRLLWAEIHGLQSWDANPWCWCLTFRRIKP